MTRHEQIETLSKKLETLDSAVLESLIKLLGCMPSHQATTEVMNDETRTWHGADLSKLAEYEPYDWRDIDPLTIGEPLRLGYQLEQYFRMFVCDLE
jgi:hypothetical protein